MKVTKVVFHKEDGTTTEFESGIFFGVQKDGMQNVYMNVTPPVMFIAKAQLEERVEKMVGKIFSSICDDCEKHEKCHQCKEFETAESDK